MTVAELLKSLRFAVDRSKKLSMVVHNGKEPLKRNVKTIHVRRDGTVEFRDTGHCFDGYEEGVVCLCQD